MVEVKQLCKLYGKKEILHDISVILPEKRIIGIIGNNGAGKTTFFKCLLKIYSLDKGNIFNSASYKKVLFDTPPQLPGMTVDKYIHFFTLLYQDHLVDGVDIDSILQKVKLKEYKKKKVSQLSYGMKKMLYISTLLIGRTDFVVVDEPFNGLDKMAREIVKDIITSLKRDYNTTVVVSSHMQDQLEDICDEIHEIENGYLKYTTFENDRFEYKLIIDASEEISNGEDNIKENLAELLLKNPEKIQIHKIIERNK